MIQTKNSLIFERLDSFFVNHDWLFKYPNVHVRHLAHTHPNRFPLLLQLYNDNPALRRKMFKFETMWTSHPEFPNLNNNT